MNKGLKALIEKRGRTFNINKDPNCLGFHMYKKSRITIREGLTILVGPNGMGKSTFIKELKRKLDKLDMPTYVYDNQHQGGNTAMQGFLNRGNIESLAAMATSSEGEKILVNMQTIAKEMGSFVRKNINDCMINDKELWIFVDALDSGFSIDNIIDVKKYLFKTIIKDCESKEVPVYIICSANSYEMCNGEYCFDVYNGNYVTFNNYEEYKEFILAQKDIKDHRYDELEDDNYIEEDDDF